MVTVSDSLIYILQFKFYMKAAVDAQIVQFEAQSIFRDEMYACFHLGPNRVSEVLRFFQDNTTLPRIPPRGRPKKVTPEILDFINVRTLQSAHLSLADLPSEVRSQFGTTISGSIVSAIRTNLGFHYQPARHLQDLRGHQIEARVEFCQKMGKIQKIEWKKDILR
jgi:transposase